MAMVPERILRLRSLSTGIFGDGFTGCLAATIAMAAQNRRSYPQTKKARPSRPGFLILENR
jgi:hypothetical protein